MTPTDEPAPGAGMGPVPPEGYAAALAGLPALGPGRLRALLATWDPVEAWHRTADGSAVKAEAVAAVCRPHPAVIGAAWKDAAGSVDPVAVWAAHVGAGVTVHVLGCAGYPKALATDHQPPPVLFVRGHLSALEGRRVGIVGTRRCTRYGRDVARQLARELATHDVRVVSGLALGIDGAAHGGALEAGGAPPIGVVGSGLDVVYPRRHASLWAQVAAEGALLSEAPLGTEPEAWRFPVRNRIIAALAEVVVVVESHSRGGSRHTVDAAEARGRPILAVPGPVTSSASWFPNALLAEGCDPARDALDVLVALGLAEAGSTPGQLPPAFDRRPPPNDTDQAVLDAMGWEPVTFDRLVAVTGLGAGAVSLALTRLERDGWVVARAGWWERRATPAAPAPLPP